MTVLAVLASPPREGLVLPRLAETSPLSAAEAAELHEAMLRDTFRAIDASGGTLLVNHPTDEQLPAAHRTDTAPAAELRAVAADTLESLNGVRFEPQVGSTFDARAGNTVTHLLREEGARSVAVLRPNTPLLTRSVVDSAAMKLRTNEAVLGPATRGRCYYAGFREPIDFEGAFAPPEVQTLTDRGRDADGEVAFLKPLPALETGDDLLDVVPYVRARVAAGRLVPTETAELIHDLGLQVVTDDDGDERLVRED